MLNNLPMVVESVRIDEKNGHRIELYSEYGISDISTEEELELVGQNPALLIGKIAHTLIKSNELRPELTANLVTPFGRVLLIFKNEIDKEISLTIKRLKLNDVGFYLTVRQNGSENNRISGHFWFDHHQFNIV